MSIPFPSGEFFTSLQGRFNDDLSSTEHLDPSDAYCGFMIGDHLFVLEFDERECSAVVAGGNELDLDFVVAGPMTAWNRAIEGVEAKDDGLGLAALVGNGELEIRSVDAEGVETAHESLPFLQVFLEASRGLDLEFA